MDRQHIEKTATALIKKLRGTGKNRPVITIEQFCEAIGDEIDSLKNKIESKNNA